MTASSTSCRRGSSGGRRAWEPGAGGPALRRDSRRLKGGRSGRWRGRRGTNTGDPPRPCELSLSLSLDLDSESFVGRATARGFFAESDPAVKVDQFESARRVSTRRTSPVTSTSSSILTPPHSGRYAPGSIVNKMPAATARSPSRGRRAASF